MVELVKHTEYTLGPVDILVNNAGCMFYQMMKNLKQDEWEKQIDINCKVLNVFFSVLFFNLNFCYNFIENRQLITMPEARTNRK